MGLYFMPYKELDGDFLQCAMEILPPERREKALAYRNVRDRNLCVLSYLLLSAALEREYAIKGVLRFSYEKEGKPHLRDFPHVHFNLSHCQHGAVCCVSDSPCGVDIQDVRPYSAKLAEKVCHPEELRSIETALSKDIEFCKIWTKKESMVKENGRGIVGDLRKINTCGTGIVKTYVWEHCVVSVRLGSIDKEIEKFML